MNYEPKSHELESLKGNSRLTETVETPNGEKIVITHKRHITPQYGDSGEYESWRRTYTVVRSDGEIVVREQTKRYVAHNDEWQTVHDHTHTFDLADDNQTVVHDGRTWDVYAKERARELTNTRWRHCRTTKPDPVTERDAVKGAIESQL